MWGRFPLTRVAIRVIEIAGAGLTSALVAYLIGRIEPAQPAPPPAVVHLAPADEEMIRTVRSDQAALLDQLRNAEARKTQATTSPATPPAASEAASQASPTAELQATAQMTPQATAQVAPPAAGVEVAVSATDLAIASAPVPKPDKSAQAPMRRDQKSERVRLVDAKADVNKADVNRADAKPRPKVEPRVAPRAEELTQARPMPGVVVDAVARNAAQRDVVAAPTAAPAPAAPPPVASAPPPESDGVLSSTLRGITAWILPSRDRVPMPDQNATRPPKAVGEFQQSSM